MRKHSKEGGVRLKLEKRERCFEVIDDLIDRGVDVLNLGKELEQTEYERVRKRLMRNFGSVENALKEYGLFTPNGFPTQLELERCFYIDDAYCVRVNEYKKEELKDLYNISDFDFRRITKELIHSLEKDAIDIFYRKEFPFEDFWSVGGLNETRIRGYIDRHFSSFKCFLDYYGLDNVSMIRGVRRRKKIKQGITFQELFGNILRVIYPVVQEEVWVGDVRPDFIVNENIWFDAKLNYYTAFDPRSNTLDKYPKRCRLLIIVYALGARPIIKENNVLFVHVSKFFPILKTKGRTDLIQDTAYFIDVAS